MFILITFMYKTTFEKIRESLFLKSKKLKNKI